jgi:hypothetical protein
LGGAHSSLSPDAHREFIATQAVRGPGCLNGPSEWQRVDIPEHSVTLDLLCQARQEVTRAVSFARVRPASPGPPVPHATLDRHTARTALALRG